MSVRVCPCSGGARLLPERSPQLRGLRGSGAAEPEAGPAVCPGVGQHQQPGLSTGPHQVSTSPDPWVS